MKSHFRRHATPNRGLTASKRRNCTMRGPRSSSHHVEGATKRGELHQ